MAFKLRTVGVICPACGYEMDVERLYHSSSWLGYFREAVCHFCQQCESNTTAMRCILLYDERKVFVTIIPGRSTFLDLAGGLWPTDEDIPF